MKITKELLNQLYIIENLSRQEIALKLNCKENTIKWLLMKHKIKKSVEGHVANIRKSCYKKYGLPNGGGAPETLKKIKQTNRKKFGKDWALQTKEVIEKRKENLRKIKGVENVFQLEEVKMKSNMTMHRNHSFGLSKPEKEIKKLLELKFNCVKYQYRSKEYSFNCDFYLPELDLYIEYQGSWTHGKKPFKNSKKDKELLNKWKSKVQNHPYYDTAIKVWIVRDPLKRKIAKENNLNWIEFFDMKQFMKWYGKQ